MPYDITGHTSWTPTSTESYNRPGDCILSVKHSVGDIFFSSPTFFDNLCRTGDGEMPSPARSLVELEKMGLVSSNRSLDLMLLPRSGHYRAVLYLRKLLFFPVGVDKFMAESVARIEPGDDGLGLHRAAVRERERSVV